MKRIQICLLSMILLFAVGSIALGAVHPNFGETPYLGMGNISLVTELMMPFERTDNWFKVSKDEPNLLISGVNYPDPDVNGIQAQYYQNENTFVALTYADNFLMNSLTEFKGSYLFESGLLLGMDYVTDGDDYISIVSPGYLYNFNDQGYLAASLDYVFGDGIDSQINGYDIDFRYYLDNAKIFGQIYKPEDYDELYIDAGLVYQATDTLAIGTTINQYDDDFGYLVGCTWNVEKVIVDFKYSFNQLFYSSHGYDLSGMFLVTDSLKLGAQYSKYADNDAYYTLKINYLNSDSEFYLAYTLENDYVNSAIYFAYKMNL